jgi:hypothetical protein
MGCVSSTLASSNSNSSFLQDPDELHEREARRQFTSLRGKEYDDSWTFLTVVGDEDGARLRDEEEEEEERKKATIFWETISAYGGSKEVWTALEMALTKTDDVAFAREILNAAGVKVCHKHALACFDERGFLYSIPKYAAAVRKRGNEKEVNAAAVPAA